jgi:hypothetical protein
LQAVINIFQVISVGKKTRKGVYDGLNEDYRKPETPATPATPPVRAETHTHTHKAYILSYLFSTLTVTVSVFWDVIWHRTPCILSQYLCPEQNSIGPVDI